ncbi:MAG: L,D-transpeptidase family protein [Salinisphaeraceae bacterium]|nr:L,D-transpeptidase family protein [Salinisphaeraceae bacterium]
MRLKKPLLWTLGLLLLAAIGLTAASAIDNARPPEKLPRIDKVEVYKGERRLELWRQGKLIKSYRISLGGNPIGHKQQEGDSRTPEGNYVIDWRNPNSKFHKSLHISYPNAADRRRAKARGVSPGGDIMIHGLPNGLDAAAVMGQFDWTDGCIAVNNREIEEIWQAVPNGTPITLHP